MIRYYIDSSVWRDLHEDRSDRFRPLGEWAFELFRMIRETRGIVLYSSLVIKELLKDFNEDEIDNIFEIVSKKHLLKKVKITNEQRQEAAKACKGLEVPFGDYLHAILARDNNAIMVTRDKHFWELQHIVEISKPEDLI